MIIVNTCHIQDMPMPVEGEEPAEILGMEENTLQQGIPVSDIEYKLLATKMKQDLLINGTASFVLQTICSRCGCEMEKIIRTQNLCLLFEKVPDQEVDITNDIREELLLAIPTYIKCKDDCAGICPTCGANLNDGPCDCQSISQDNALPSPEENPNSPWAALDDFDSPKS